MTDIEPALTAEMWKHCSPKSDREKLEAIRDMLDPFIFPADAPRVMALANAALADDDPRKITREKLRALDAIISASADHWDKGPPNEGWQSEELSGNVAMARELRDAIAALLPP